MKSILRTVYYGLAALSIAMCGTAPALAACVLDGASITGVATNSIICDITSSLDIQPPDGALTNTSTLNNNFGATLNNNNNLTNEAQLINAGTLNNNVGGFLYNSNLAAGVFVNNSGATVNNFGDFVNGGYATIFNYGTWNGVAPIDNFGQFNNAGTVTGKFYNDGGTLNNTGMVTVDRFFGAGTINNSAAITSYSTNSTTSLVNNAGATFNNFGTSIDYYAPNSLSNAGTLTNTATLEPSALVNQAGGTLNNSGSLFSGGSGLVNAGTLSNTGSLLVDEARPMQNSGTLSNAGTLYVGWSLQNSGTLSNSGTVTVGILGTLDNSGTFSNTGTVIVGGPGVVGLIGTGTFSQTGGTTQVDGRMSQSDIEIAGGLLKGTGFIGASTFTIGPDGTVAPGDSPGTLTLAGNVTFAGTLEIELASATSFDVLKVLGALNFNPSAHFSFLLGFGLTDPTYSFHFLDADSITGINTSMYDVAGNFDGYTSNLMCTSIGCDLTFGPVPEPETYAMLLAGLGLLGFAGRSRKQKATQHTTKKVEPSALNGIIALDGC